MGSYDFASTTYTDFVSHNFRFYHFFSKHKHYDRTIIVRCNSCYNLYDTCRYLFTDISFFCHKDIR